MATDPTYRTKMRDVFRFILFFFPVMFCASSVTRSWRFEEALAPRTANNMHSDQVAGQNCF